MAKPTPSKFVLSILPLALVACGQSVTELNSRDDGSKLIEANGQGEADAAATSEPDANTGAPEPTGVPSSPVTSPVNSDSTVTSAEESTSVVDPRPEKPGRGVVSNDAPDFSDTGCCSRVTGAPQSPFCPPGQGSTTFGELADGADKLQGPPSPASVGVPFEISPVMPLGERVQFAIEETTIDPPSGLLDLSPVYWVWSAKQSDTPLFVRVPTSTNNPTSEADTVHIFFSPDGAEYSRVEYDYLNAGFLQGTLPGPGFVVAGVTDPARIQCN